MKICFNRLSPYRKFQGLYSNGDVVDLDEKTALEYINSNLAFEVNSFEAKKRVDAVKKQTKMNEIRRLKILSKNSRNKNSELEQLKRFFDELKQGKKG